MATMEKPHTGSDLHYGHDGMDRLYARVWGDSIHFGYYDKPGLDLEAAVTQAKQRMAQCAGLRVGDSILEVASGWGATARYLARACGVSVTATNLEQEFIDKARGLSLQAGLQGQIRHQQADYHDLPFADNRFDVWWCQEATVHARNKPQVFSEAYRCLRPGGRIVFSDQTTRRQLCRAGEALRLAHRHGSDDLYDADDFRAVLQQCGFQRIEVHDWSRHMARHFAKLVNRMECTYAVLQRDVPERTLAFNLSLWRLGRDLAARGAIGWHCFSGVKQ